MGPAVPPVMGMTLIEALRASYTMPPPVPPAGVLSLFPSLLVPLLLIAFPASVWPAVIAYHAWCLGIAVAFAAPTDRRLQATALHPYRFIAITTILAGLGAEVIARGYVDVRPWLPGQWMEVARRAMPWSVFAIYSLVVHTYAEERFWREALLSGTAVLPARRRSGWCTPPRAGSCWVRWRRLPAGSGRRSRGVVWGVAARRYQAIWPCVLTHVVLDAAILRVLWALPP